MQAKQTKGSTWTFTNLVNLVNIPLHGQKDTKEKLLARPPVMAQDWHSDIPAACPSLRLPRGPRHPTAAPSPLICPSHSFLQSLRAHSCVLQHTIPSSVSFLLWGTSEVHRKMELRSIFISVQTVLKPKDSGVPRFLSLAERSRLFYPEASRAAGWLQVFKFFKHCDI